jgi:signal transduction histidine kinase
VETSHPVEKGLSAQNLTDGRPYTLVHPRERTLGADFSYLIDLGRVWALDHISLRQRNDSWDINRFSRVHVQIYQTKPAAGAAAEWSGIDRADGTFPEVAAVDVLRAEDGRGKFQGRYVRISSDSPVPCSPQLAEVEVYARRTPVWLAVRADGKPLPRQDNLEIPARFERLTFDLNIPQPGLPPDQVLRWRLLGQRQDWQMTRDFTVDFPVPPTGSYTLEIQAAHSDGMWDATMLRVPLRRLPPFTDTAWFRAAVSVGALLVGAAAMTSYSRRRIAILEAKSALADERTRIARDMHDDVGARLAQLAVLHDIFVRQYPQVPEAQQSLEEMGQVARQVVASLDEVVWTVDPQNDTLTSTAEYLAQYALSYLSPLHIGCRLQAPIDWPKVEIHAHVRHELILAFKEALQNVVKHSGATEVILTMRHERARFVMELADNGCGLSAGASGPGHDGLINMAARLQSAGGSSGAANRSPSGTIVTLQIPLHS